MIVNDELKDMWVSHHGLFKS